MQEDATSRQQPEPNGGRSASTNAAEPDRQETPDGEQPIARPSADGETEPIPTDDHGEGVTDGAAPTAIATPTKATVIDLGQQRDKVRFTFQEAPWPDVLREFADWSGTSLDLTDTPEGYFSYFDNRTHTPTEAIDILNGYLLPRGFVLLRRDQFLVCLKTDNPMLARLIPRIELEELDRRGDNDLVRLILPLDEVPPETAAEEVGGLLGPLGKATPLATSRSLMLQGFGGALRQAIQVLNKSRPPVTDDKLDFRAFRIEHLPVADTEKQIRNLFGIDSPAQARNVSRARYEINRYSRDRDRRGRDRNDDASEPAIPLLQQVAMNMQVSSLESTNTLLVTATPEGLALVEEVLQSIDVPADRSAEEMIASTEPELRVYGMVSADESEVAKTLDVLMPGVVVNEDRRQDTIHVFGTPEQHREVQRLMRILDVSEGGSRTVEVIRLQRSNPAAVASFLNELFSNEDRDERPMIQAEIGSRSVIVRGTENQVEEVRAALRQFGEPGSSESIGRNRQVRRVDVGGLDAQTIAEIAERLYSQRASEKDDRGIRVVVPRSNSDRSAESVRRRIESSSVGPMSRPARPEHPDSLQPGLSATLASNKRARQAPTASRLTSTDSPAGSEERENDEATSTDRERSDSRSTVRIEVVGDQLLVLSGDPDAAEAVENTLRELIRQMPNRTRWTVFYLEAAEAGEAAARLNQLMIDQTLPSGSESGLFLSDTAPVPLQIVPDERTNSLFVSGTERQVEQVETFLEYIDATEVPTSFMNRQPHAIQVQYADVEEIADLLRNLYKDYLVDPVAERMRASGRDNDRRGGRNESSRPTAAELKDSPGIRLTLAVDSQTGELLVACNDQLFREIEAVVQQRDLAVRDRQPTVQVVPISGTTPENLVELLEGYSPRLTVQEIVPETSASRNNRTNRNNGNRRPSRSRRPSSNRR